MDVRCLFFAAARERAGVDEIKLSLPQGSRSGEAARELERLYPSLKEVLGRSRIAVNGEFADPERVLKQGDELAVIPPVSGG